MTEAMRHAAALRYRQLLDDPVLHRRAAAEGKKARSLAAIIVFQEYGIRRASLYRYCKRFRVSTR